MQFLLCARIYIEWSWGPRKEKVTFASLYLKYARMIYEREEQTEENFRNAVLSLTSMSTVSGDSSLHSQVIQLEGIHLRSCGDAVLLDARFALHSINLGLVSPGHKNPSFCRFSMDWEGISTA